MARLAATSAFPLLLLAVAQACSPDTHVHDEGRAPRWTEVPVAGQGMPGPGPIPDGAADSVAPQLDQVSVSVAAGCLRVRAASSKAVDATVSLTAADVSEQRELGRGASLFDVAFAPGGLPAGAKATAVVSAVDAQGHRVMAAPTGFQVPAAPALPLVISEVMPNPAGPETTQEYVELLNRGQTPTSLAGLSLEDETGRDALPDAEVPPGARALVVGQGFDEASAADVPPTAGTMIVRLPGRLGRDGLKQTGEAVRLVAADGTVISSYGGWVDTTRGAWQGKSIQRQPDEAACDHPRSWSMAPLTPTPGS
jgi:hypothetical protein